jgi:hypothetical protein
MVGSAILKTVGKDDWALFVGQSATFLIMGVYNKTVKQHGSDASSGYSGRGSLTYPFGRTSRAARLANRPASL